MASPSSCLLSVLLLLLVVSLCSASPPPPHCNVQLPFAFGDNYNGQLGNGDVVRRSVAVQVVFKGLNISAVSAGGSHSLVLANGQPYAFGSNKFGQLGDGSNSSSSKPVPVSVNGALDGLTIVAVSGGGKHSLVLSESGYVFSFGANAQGQLGDGTNTNKEKPIAVYTSGILNTTKIKAIAAGFEFSLILSTDGLLYSFGSNNYGQLGDDSSTDKNVPVAVFMGGALNGKTITAISAGGWHSLVLSSGGEVFSFGNNDNGQLGTGNTLPAITPTEVYTAGALSGVSLVGIAAAKSHSLVLSSTGQVFSFGYSSFGQLGYGGSSPYPIPNPVPVLTTGVLNETQITTMAGGDHSLVLSSTGRVFSFGYNYYGQLGDGTNWDRLSPVAVDTSGVLDGMTITTVSTGYTHSLVLTDSGQLFSFGDNSDGQLGDGTNTFTPAPSAVNASEILVTSISSGDRHSLLLSSTGQLFSFGYNLFGQLGDGTNTDRLSPVAVDTSGVLDGKTITAISAGVSHSLVLSADGLVFSFGRNYYGQLGDGSISNRNTPVVVPTYGALNGQTITAISAGGYHSLLLSATGQVFSFGYNFNGQLGNNENTNRWNPVAVNASGVLYQQTITAIAAGGTHSLLLSETGEVFSFGNNAYGQLGDGTLVDKWNPVAVLMSGVPNGQPVTAIAGGGSFSLVLLASGEVFSFGYNEHGQLGDGTNLTKNVPVAVDTSGVLGRLQIRAIAAGFSHSLVLSSTGQVFAFGYNFYGQLGDGTETNRNAPIAVYPHSVFDGLKFSSIAAGNLHSLVLPRSQKVTIAGKVWDGSIIGEQSYFQSATDHVTLSWEAFMGVFTDDQSVNATSYNITTIELGTDRIVVDARDVTFTAELPVFSYSHSNISLIHNMTYITTVSTNKLCFDPFQKSIGFLVDTTPPEIDATLLQAEFWQTDGNLTIEWDGVSDPESGINRIEIVIIDAVTNSTVPQPGCSVLTMDTSGQHEFMWSECGMHLPPAMPFKVAITVVNGASLQTTMISESEFQIVGVRITDLIGYDGTSSTAFKACRQASVKWSSFGLNGTLVMLSVIDASSDSFVLNITHEPVPVEQNTFTWEPVPVSLFGQYRIELTSGMFPLDPTPFSVSGIFTVQAADSCITIISPNETSNWKVGVTQTIEWTYLKLGDAVILALLENHTFKSVIGSTAIQDGHYTWTIPTTLVPAQRYQVRASASQESSVVFTTGSFAISTNDFDRSTQSSSSDSSSSQVSSGYSGASISSNNNNEDTFPVPLIIGIGTGVALLVFLFIFLLILVAVIALVIGLVVLALRRRASGNQQQQPLSKQPTVRVEYNALEIPIKELKILEKLGRGAYGNVFKATYRGSNVALKLLEIDSDGLGEFLKEAGTMAQLQHPRLLQFVGVVNDNDKFGIVTEFMDRGSLDKLLWRKQTARLSWQVKMGILNDVAAGMAFIHSRGFIHRDLKSPNILIGEANRAKVGDFGLARTMDKSASTMTDKQGTPLWMAPEVVESTGHYDNKCDVYSFGIIMWELLNEKEPYHDIQNKQSVMFNVVRDPNFRPSIPNVTTVMELHSTDEQERESIDKVFEPFLVLMRECWTHNPTSRPTFEQVVERLNDLTKTF